MTDRPDFDPRYLEALASEHGVKQAMLLPGPDHDGVPVFVRAFQEGTFLRLVFDTDAHTPGQQLVIEQADLIDLATEPQREGPPAV